MPDPLAFHPRRDPGQASVANHPESARLAGKLQRLALERPYALRIIEQAVDQLLAELDHTE